LRDLAKFWQAGVSGQTGGAQANGVKASPLSTLPDNFVAA
jgi:hypothetical protein